MTLRDAMLDDLEWIFSATDEFSRVHIIDGREVKCLVDDQCGLAETGVGGGFSSASGLGVLACDRVVLCLASDLDPLPLPGQRLDMDGFEWLVAESGLSETEGLLRLPLNRAY